MFKIYVENYEKMIKEFIKAWEDLGQYAHARGGECMEVFEKYNRDLIKMNVPTYNCFLEVALYLEDGTHILTDWERAKAIDREFHETVKSLNIRGRYISNYGLCEYNNLTPYLQSARNILAYALDSYWLPKLEKQGGYRELPSGSEIDFSPLGSSGFIGGCVAQIVCVLQSLGEMCSLYADLFTI